MSPTEVSTSFENITYEVKGSIAYIIMNRPKVMNALNRKTVEELNAAFHAAKDDATVKGVILQAPISLSSRPSTARRRVSSPRKVRRRSRSSRHSASL